MASPEANGGPEPPRREAVTWRGMLLLACLALVLAATLFETAQMARRNPDVVELTLLHMNDVYEIAPLVGSDQGGLARVAGLRKKLLAENPNTLTLMAGDLLSPSAMGDIDIGGEKMAGRQMVDVLKHSGLDLATLGNHEFDLSQDQLEKRLKEARPAFRWLSANVTRTDGSAFPEVLPHAVITVKNRSGAALRVGVFGLTIKTTKDKDYVVYEPPRAAAEREVAALRDQVDVLVAMTHLSMNEDRDIAVNVQGIDLILGGHEHENARVLRGSRFTPILKADANARTVYVHRLSFDTRNRRLTIESELHLIDANTPTDPEVDKLVKDWTEKAYAALRAQGFEPLQVVATGAPTLDGTEANVRNQSTALTRLIADGMLKSAPDADLALFNSGSIRIDDTIAAGKLAQWDAFRILPYRGTLALVELDGDTLKTVLDAGELNRGSGGFLQTANVASDPTSGGWVVAGRPLQSKRRYRVVLNDFLLRGQERGLSVLKRDRVTVLKTDIVEVRKSLIDAMRSLPPGSTP